MENDQTPRLIDEADRHFSAGRIDAAKQAYEQVVAEEPGNAWAYSRLGAIAAREGDLETAEAMLKKALESDPELPQAHSNMGNLYYTRGQYAQAEICYRAAIALDPTNPLYHENLHAAYKKMKKYAEAVASIKHANKLKNTQAKEAMSQDRDRLRGLLKRPRGCLGSAVLLALLCALLAAVALL